MLNNLIAFIPARKGSKSIKNKNLKFIKSKSLVEITIDQAKKTGLFKNIILSSDSKKILNIGKRKKISTVFRPKKISSDKSTTEKALYHAINYLNDENKLDSGIVILQPTSPLRKISSIKNFVKTCIKKKYDNALTVSKIDHNISIENIKKKFKPLINKNLRRRQDRSRFMFENGSMYFVIKKKFLKDKKIYTPNWNYIETDIYESLDINNIKDLKIARIVYNKI